jgi:two-component system, OmpR family, manganese sensing sensor histidine kinase
MALDIDSSPIDDKLIRKLITANLIVFILVLLVLCGCVYGFASTEAYVEQKQELSLFVGSLISSIDPGELEPDILSATRSEPTTIPLKELQIEWYTPDGKRLYTLGGLKITLPYNKNAEFQKQKEPRALVLTRPAVLRGSLMGYVRVGQSLAQLDKECERLLTGLALGIVCSLVASGIGVFWLTRQSLKPIEEAFLRLKRFTDDASHEFGTPLMAMKSNLSLVLMRSPGLSTEDRERLLVVDSTIDGMTDLANDLLLLARADRKESSNQNQVVDVRALLEKTVATFKSMAEEKSTKLACQCDHGVFVKGNFNDLERMIGNIVKNAILYTMEQGDVKVTASTVEDKVEIKVTDTGIGMAQGDLSRLFERFWRGDRARAKRSGGSGLGLSIAKKIVEQHGGNISVTSQLDQGSCFVVLLPLCAETVNSGRLVESQ